MRTYRFFPYTTSFRCGYDTCARVTVVFDSTGRDVGRDDSRWNDGYLTRRGQYGARSTRSDPDDENSTVMHVAAPIRDAGGRIAGVLTVSKPNQAIAPFIERSQQAVLRWGLVLPGTALLVGVRSEAHTSELQSLMRISYAVFCLKHNTDEHKTTR